MSPSPKTQKLYFVVSDRDGERVGGPFPKEIAAREKDRFEREQKERRNDAPVHPVRRGIPETESPTVEVIRELAGELARPDLLERLDALAPAATTLEPSAVRRPTTYSLEPTVELDGFDPFDEEPHADQRTRLRAELEED